MNWLLNSDVSIQFQVHRDLLGEERPDLQARIATEGWGKAVFDKRGLHGHWGQGYYQPKWISRRTKDGCWKVQAPYAGEVHFTKEKAGTESRWNTLRAMRV